MEQENLEDILKTFEPISLDQMSSVKLMNRTDTKFVTNLDKLKHLRLPQRSRRAFLDLCLRAGRRGTRVRQSPQQVCRRL
jgi:hypothetical protein